MSMVFVTHDLRVALRISDRIAVMRAGEIVELAAAATIFATPRHPYTSALFAAVPGKGEGIIGSADPRRASAHEGRGRPQDHMRQRSKYD
jgi:ABC-type dipeptide/oligopeptide/nickel transport system ATPase component